MKTIILYATKHGAAAEIARRLAGKIPDSVMYDLKKGSVPSLSQYDCVILGGSVYAGMLRKEAKNFAALNAAVLCEKKLGLFLSGLSLEGGDKYFNSNFPAELLKHAAAKSLLGGIFDPKKTGGFERFILKMVTKQSNYFENISDERIDDFARTMNL